MIMQNIFDDFDIKVNIEEIDPFYMLDDEDYDVWMENELDEDWNL